MIIGFLGPSGAGKSTTQKVIIGILQHYRGSVRVFGADLAGKRPAFYERIGVSFELPNVYTKLTARENLAFFRSLYSGDTEEPAALLEMVGLAGLSANAEFLALIRDHEVETIHSPEASLADIFIEVTGRSLS